MAMLEGFRIQNYRVLRDVTFGKLWNTQHVNPLTPLTAVIGKNGVGKSTVFDALGFLADALKVGVEEALRCSWTRRISAASHAGAYRANPVRGLLPTECQSATDHLRAIRRRRTGTTVCRG